MRPVVEKTAVKLVIAVDPAGATLQTIGPSRHSPATSLFLGVSAAGREKSVTLVTPAPSRHSSAC